MRCGGDGAGGRWTQQQHLGMVGGRPGAGVDRHGDMRTVLIFNIRVDRGGVRRD